MRLRLPEVRVSISRCLVVLVAVPARFTEMQRDASDAAQAWRMATRDAFQAYFKRGYRAVDFFLDRERGGGSYLLAAGGGASL